MSDEKARLQADRERTLAELKRLRGYLSTELDRISFGGDNAVDAAGDLHEREKALAFIQTLERKLAAIDNASAAADEGRYGTCEICGNQINPARLEIMPQATTCVSCQGKLERSRRPGTWTFYLPNGD